MEFYMKAWFGIPFTLVVSVFALSACSSAPQTGTQVDAANAQTVAEVRIDGSSTVFPITDAIAQKFRQANPDAKVTVAVSGTGGGFKLFCAGQTDINNASRPISTEEMEACRSAGISYVEIPIAFDALSVVVNPQNTWATSLTVEELAAIWDPSAEGIVTRWNQVRPTFPDRPLTLYGPGTDSGTYDYFTDVIIGEKMDSRRDYIASEDDDVLVRGIESDPNALGYFGYAYYKAEGNKLKAVAIDSGRGPVAPSEQAVQLSQYQPLARPLFIYVSAGAVRRNPMLRPFVEFYMNHAAQTVAEVGYIPLPARAYQIGLGHLYRGKVGTAYDGVPQPNLTIAEVMQKQRQY